VLPPPPSAQNNGHSGHNPYDFIVNPNTEGKRVGLAAGLGGNSFMVKIGLLIGGAALVMIVVALLLSALAPKGNATGMTGIAERQQEMIRVSTNALQQQLASSQDAKNFLSNIQASISSEQAAVLNYLSANGTKLGSSTLALDHSTETDSQLSYAASANNFDSAVTQNLTSQLQAYQALLKTTYAQTSSTQAKAILQKNFNDSALLLKQANTLSAELQ
jgi:hypothetical protein